MAGRSRFIGVPIVDEPPPLLTCDQCDFIVPPTSGHPVNALKGHQRMIHQGRAEFLRVKPQFLALVEATGSFDIACKFADTVITWTRPDDETLREWSVEAEQREDEGRPLVSQKQVERMERRLRRAQEWQSRLALKSMTQASMKLSDEVVSTGTTEKPQLMQYTGMNVSYMNKEIANAYQQVRAPAIANQIVINAGEPPPKRVNVIEAEVRELGSGTDV